MLRDPLDSYDQAQAHQEQLWYEAQLDGWAKEAAASNQAWAEHPLPGFFPLMAAMVFIRKAQSLAKPALASSSRPSAVHPPTSGCQKSVANMLNHSMPPAHPG